MSFPEGARTARTSSALWTLGSESVADPRAPTEYFASEVYTFGSLMVVVDADGRFVSVNLFTRQLVRVVSDADHLRISRGR